MQNDKIKLTDKQEESILKVIDYQKKLREMQEQLKSAKAEVIKILSAERFTNVKLDFGFATICKKSGYTRETIDGDKLKELYPSIAEECKKETYVNETLSIVFK